MVQPDLEIDLGELNDSSMLKIDLSRKQSDQRLTLSRCW